MIFSKGYAYSLLSVILMALAGPLQKLALIELDPVQVLFFSNLAAFSAGSVFSVIHADFSKMKSRKTIIILSILYSLAQCAFSFAVNLENPVIVNAISRSYLFFNFAISFFFLKDKFSARHAGASLLILVGTLGLSMTENLRWSMAAGLTIIYSLFFSIHNSLLKTAENQNTYQLIIFQNGLACLLFGLVSLHRPLHISEGITPIFYACLAGFLSSFLGFVFYRKGLNYLRFSEASSIRSLSPIIGFCVIYPFFPVKLSVVQMIAFVLILIGCLSFNMKRNPDEPA